MSDKSLPFPASRAPVASPALLYPDESSLWDALWTTPEIDPSAWVAPGAVVIGRVRLKARSSIWYGCVLRGDGDFIEVGEETNVQDGSILHVDQGFPCVLGNRVTLGHRALVHASVVGDGAMIAIDATVLSRCVIGEQALIAAGAVVLEGTQVPPANAVGGMSGQANQGTQRWTTRAHDPRLETLRQQRSIVARQIWTKTHRRHAGVIGFVSLLSPRRRDQSFNIPKLGERLLQSRPFRRPY